MIINVPSEAFTNLLGQQFNKSVEFFLCVCVKRDDMMSLRNHKGQTKWRETKKEFCTLIVLHETKMKSSETRNKCLFRTY